MATYLTEETPTPVEGGWVTMPPAPDAPVMPDPPVEGGWVTISVTSDRRPRTSVGILVARA